MRTAVVGVLLALAPAWTAAAQPEKEAVRLVLDASRALQAGNAPLFLSYFDRERTPEFERLRELVFALTDQKDVASSVDTVVSAVEGPIVKLEVDWLLQLTPHREPGALEERQETLSVEVRVGDGKARIVRIEPVEFFRPR